MSTTWRFNPQHIQLGSKPNNPNSIRKELKDMIKRLDATQDIAQRIEKGADLKLWYEEYSLGKLNWTEQDYIESILWRYGIYQ